MTDPAEITVFCGLDVGKSEHHATALTAVGKKVLDKRLPNTEEMLRAIFDKLMTKHGPVLVAVRSAGVHWDASDRGRSRRRLPGGVSTGFGDAPYRRPVSR